MRITQTLPDPGEHRARIGAERRVFSALVGRELERLCRYLEPCGMGNPRPVFHAAPVEIVDGPRSLKERHLKMTFAQDGRRFRAIAWRAAERAEFLEKHRSGVDLAFSLERNEFQGETYLELSVADFRALE